ncbi:MULTISPECIES: histidinol dehydrogenase [unclassified Mucilaginibacter]|uniref:histidinol dehydrogenase n=1 Tax=unclassified Mucilaginibacter TaxID=2617802 RepID=UPI002AC8F47A|nr:MULTISPECIES: histidinol dehydrogenase [unclassified Mucilaginibacter]MEB0248730.1 histidinol dehydrogenase [Mucilaginibacter sp. 5B2]MEB0263317.1 histidinol dehydrogenase [Mucilaginibacter sp. 10I4]MEB0280737.1 histidinol dehydrogenase [Mucilaginibacter sp. 10B2]MEB0301454.1 histidinol dehydrogenase [Mucilaginibacter sp. 5C4]WPX22674.1 histidinol dehydrogenase [Mucilaginibacter sp. 5C4]
METFNYSELSKTDIARLVQRNVDPANEIRALVEEVIENVKQHGDSALIDYASKFDKVDLTKLYLDKAELEEIASAVSEDQQEALQTAYANIYKFHKAQLKDEDKVETMPGVTCWRELRAIEKVGLYIPGGTAVLPSTFLMLGIPARIAGCKEIVVCSPPQKNGKVNAFIAYVALMLGINKVYLVGGSQAIASMAYGTETIAKVDKIFGPGNQFVTKAKTIIQSTTTTAIDMPAGPSEVLVIADRSAKPAYVAADLLAQAEHGIDSQSILVCTSQDIADKTLAEVQKQLAVLPRYEIAKQALDNSYIIITQNLDEAMDFSNEYAPEHLILATEKWKELTPNIINAGSVFLGNLTPESAGDYASGTNHTLPTSSYARAYSGVSVDSFVKKITFQYLTEEGIKNIGPSVEILAEMEGLHAHRNAVSVRMKK